MDINFKSLADVTNALIAEVQSITTFEKVNDWDSRARAKIEELQGILAAMDADLATLTQDTDQAKRDNEGKGAIGRFFANRKADQKVKSANQALAVARQQLGELCDKLESFAEMTPDNLEEQKLLLTELRERKKDLQLQKKEVVTNMHAIRVAARQKTAASTKQAKRWVRWDKEAKLRPNEDAKAALERQIIEVERSILWVQKIK